MLMVNVNLTSKSKSLDVTVSGEAVQKIPPKLEILPALETGSKF